MKSKLIFTALLLFITHSATTLASTSTEAETLAKIDHEITALGALVKTAKAQSDRTKRIQFDYQALEADLELVKQGIRRHVLSPRVQPRSYPALKGDYR